MSSDENNLIDKLPINGIFDNIQLEEKNSKPDVSRYKNNKGIELKKTSELVTIPEKEGTWKLAYGKLYHRNMPDFDIELAQIKKWEPKLKSTTSSTKKKAERKLKFHYKQAVAHCSPKFAAGWNRWSDDILEMFLSDKLHKVLWGSGNCGKSAIMGLLLYVKWRVNPPGRMIVIASKIVKDASARVFGYIKDIHTDAPISWEHNIELVDSSKEKAIYHIKIDPDTGKRIRNDRACIISLPVKVNAKTADVGSNLLGKHPQEWLCIGFDESQELPGLMLEMKIFLNWYTNDNIEIFSWGNPQPVDFYAKDEHDLLYRLGAGGMSLQVVKKMEKQSGETFVKTNKDTYLLHLTMNDSPKDDKEEVYNYIENPDGTRHLRLHFIAGRDNLERIAEKVSPNSPAWYSQVLGFPYIDTTGESSKGVLSPFILKKSKEYPLQWHTPEKELQWFMGVDPSISGHGDDCSIVIGRMGEMLDGRMGIDLMGGKWCRKVKPIEGEDFINTTIDTMYVLSQELNIPLRNIAIETHGSGDVLRYAMQTHIESGRWRPDVARGETYHVPDPTQSPSERMLFKTLGKMRPTKEIVDRRATEYWLAARCAILNRQLFNVPDFIINQFYNRYFTQSASQTKYKLETKQDMKKRGVKSPNDADALCNLVDVCRKYGYVYRFYNKGGYVYKYGPHAQYIANQELVDQRMGIVSRMLQISNEYHTPEPVQEKKKGKRSKYFTNDV